jgi:phage replication O-like protein O
MSSGIQIENGNFARIHNDISERLAHTDLNGSEFRCLWFLLRKTYGFQKKEDDISYSQFSEGTKLDRRNVMRSLEKMVQRCIIYRRENGNNRPQTWGFNKYFEQWDQTSGESTTASSVESTAILAETGGQSTPSGGGESTTRIAQTSGQICTSSGESTTTSSGESTTTSSGESTTHKRYKDIDKDNTKDNSAVPSLGDPLIDAANRKWRMGQKGARSSASWQAEMNLRLEPAKRVPLVTAIGKACGLTALMSKDEVLCQVHDVACWFYENGYTTAEKVEALHKVYLSDEWRRKNHSHPNLEAFSKFASAQLDELPAVPESPKPPAAKVFARNGGEAPAPKLRNMTILWDGKP